MCDHTKNMYVNIYISFTHNCLKLVSEYIKPETSLSFERFSEYSQHVTIQHAKPEADLAVAWLHRPWELVSGAANPVLPGSQSYVITSISNQACSCI